MWMRREAGRGDRRAARDAGRGSVDAPVPRGAPQGGEQPWAGQGSLQPPDGPAPMPAAGVIQKGTRVMISLWDSLMFGRVPKKRRGVFGYPPKH